MRRNALSPVLLVAGLLGLATASCARPDQAAEPSDGRVKDPRAFTLSLKPTDFKDLERWKGDRVEEAFPAFLHSCDGLKNQDPQTALGPNASVHGTVGDLQAICGRARSVDPANPVEIRAFFERNFLPYGVADRQDGQDDDEGLFTGYYEPLLLGSFTPSNFYHVPLYKRPKDIVTAELSTFETAESDKRLIGRLLGDRYVPYHTRAEIEGGALTGRGLELLWVSSPVDAFFLHVQGSGRIRLEDDSEIRVGFGGRNGHRYTAIGRVLVDRGVLKKEDVSLQSIRAWLESNPDGAADVMNQNKSFIFFKINKDPSVRGAAGVPLTAGRSLAVDPLAIRLGLPVWLETTDPLDPANNKPLHRLTMAQDTGSAIKGAVRGDLFWGFGKDAEARAGLMKEKGRYFVLLPRPALKFPKSKLGPTPRS